MQVSIFCALGLKKLINTPMQGFWEILSHARTVVQECYNGDDESLWKRGKFDPRHPKTP